MSDTLPYRLICRLGLLCALLGALGGCAGRPAVESVVAPPLTAAEQARIGEAVEARLLQILGGPYHDPVLVEELNRLAGKPAQRAMALRLAVADRSAPALYPLPGGRAVLTRGLLAGVQGRGQLDAYLDAAARLAGELQAGPLPGEVTGDARLLLAGQESLYDADSAAIRLARYFAGAACAGDCLPAVGVSAKRPAGDAAGVPAPVRRLADLQPGYDLLAQAQELERSGDQSRAIATALQAAAQAPDEPRILGTLGLAYLRAGDLQQARLHLEKAVRLQPDYYRTTMGIGYLALQGGQLRRAQETLAASVRLLPVAENLFLLAEAMEQGGDTGMSRLLYQQVVRSDRDSKLGRTAAARLAEPAGDQ